MTRMLLTTAVLCATAITPLAAQQAYGPRDLVDPVLAGRAGAGRALATGVAAAQAAPALLGAAHGWQVVLPLTLSAGVGTGPVTPADVRAAGDVWSQAEREAWLQTLEGQPFAFGAQAEVGSFGLQVGRTAISLSHTVQLDGILPTDAVEAALFGNAGRTGQPRDLDLRGGSAGGAIFTTLRVAHGRPVVTRGDATVYAGLGVDLRFIHGIGLLPATAGAITTDPLEANVRFTGQVIDPDGGTAVARQLRLAPSVAVVTPRWRATATLEGALSTTSALTGRVQRGRLDVRLDETTREAETGYTDGDAADLAALTAMARAPRQLRLGGAYRVHPRIWVAADAVTAAQEIGQVRAASGQVAVGTEVRVGRALVVRGGAHRVAEAMGYRGGLGIGLGPVLLDVAYGRTPDLGQEQVAFGLRLGGRADAAFQAP